MMPLSAHSGDRPTLTAHYLFRIAGMALMLFVAMVLIRSAILGYYWDWQKHPLTAISHSTLGSFQDGLYLAGLSLAFMIGIWLARNRPGVQRCFHACFLIAALISFFAAVANIRFIQFFGRPFNYQWLYYSDFLQSVDSHQAMTEDITRLSVLLFTLACAVLMGLSILAARGIQRAFGASGQRRVAWIATLGMACLYFGGGGWWVNRVVARHEWHPAKFENAVFAFIGSFWEARHRPGLFTMKTNVNVDELRPVGERPPEVAPRPWNTNASVRNVIFFVLESVAAEYTEPFGGTYPVTPTMNRYRTRSALFTRFYALAPNTLKTIFSLQSSVYPWVSYQFITKEHPGLAVPTLTSELKQRGYRTAFFNSADNRFQSMGAFMSNHGVDRVEDWRDRDCKHPKIIGSTEDWPFLDGNDDKCTVDYLLRWIEEKPGQPFCAILWTMMTHYPYFALGPEQDYGVGDKQFNRYLNGLRYSDEALGLLLEHLENRGLMDSTLVVVVGDHGESFMQHGKRAHSAGLYEENVHVPLMLINPRLFDGREFPTLGGMVDLPATVLHVLDQPLPAQWQGRSLFSTNRSEQVYFFSPWSDYWFGYRERDLAFLYNASLDRAEVYDMAKDPLQKTNIVNRSEVAASIERIAAWIQYQNAYIDKLVKATPK